MSKKTENSALDLKLNFKEMAKNHLQMRFADSPEFEKNFIKTFSDLVFSANSEQMEDLTRMNQNTLLNAVFRATETGASFAKKEVSLIPFAEKVKVKEGDIEKTISTGKLNAVVVFDINFQKQEILKLKNCKKLFTAEVKEGVKVIEDLTTGNYIFIGENDATKKTIGYYACFITTEGERYDLFMTNAEIIERAEFSPNFKKDNYAKSNGNIHFEKIVVRNLLKEIPKVSEQLNSILSYDEQFTEYVDVSTGEILGAESLEEAKKMLAQGEIVEPEHESKSEPEPEPEPKPEPELKKEQGDVVTSETFF